jgi:hypothetical protein
MNQGNGLIMAFGGVFGSNKKATRSGQISPTRSLHRGTTPVKGMSAETPRHTFFVGDVQIRPAEEYQPGNKRAPAIGGRRG